MMTALIVLFTVLLILDCLLLGLLILVQLPKKEAGVGMAFGGGAADALFGAGSGTALTQLTKYTAGAFFVLVFALSFMNNHLNAGNSSEFKRQFERSSAPVAPATVPANNSAAPAASQGVPLLINSNLVTPTAPPATAPATPGKTVPAPAKAPATTNK